MKAWISKYALSKGIIETETDEQTPGMTFFSNNMYFDSNSVGIHWHRSKKGALLRAEEMRLKKISSLEKQIKKLEKMKFI